MRLSAAPPDSVSKITPIDQVVIRPSERARSDRRTDGRTDRRRAGEQTASRRSLDKNAAFQEETGLQGRRERGYIRNSHSFSLPPQIDPVSVASHRHADRPGMHVESDSFTLQKKPFTDLLPYGSALPEVCLHSRPPASIPWGSSDRPSLLAAEAAAGALLGCSASLGVRSVGVIKNAY